MKQAALKTSTSHLCKNYANMITVVTIYLREGVMLENIIDKKTSKQEKVALLRHTFSLMKYDKKLLNLTDSFDP